MNKLKSDAFDILYKLENNEIYGKQIQKTINQFYKTNLDESIDENTYTLDKGTDVIMCMRNNNGKIYDYNTLLYVFLHEISHMICTDIGHTKQFSEINKLLINEAIKLNKYKYIDYSIAPIKYCGKTIKNNIINV